MTLAADLADWWGDQLRTIAVDLLPSWRPSSLPGGGPDAPAGLLVGADVEPGRSRIAALLSGRLARRGIVPCVPDRSFLLRQLAPAPLPFSELARMAELDVVAHTPFRLEDVYVLLLAHPDGRLAHARYAIVKRAILRDVLATAERERARIDGLLLGAGGAPLRVYRRSFRAAVPPHRSARLGLAFRRLALVALLAGGAATFLHASYRYTAASQAIAAELDGLRAAAASVRAKIDAGETRSRRVADLLRRKAEALSVIDVWEEVTRVLPDSAFASDLSVDRDGITLTGFARNAADLVSALERSPSFEAVAFATPVTRLPGEQQERFTIRMLVTR